MPIPKFSGFFFFFCSYVPICIQLWVSQIKNGYRPIGKDSEDSNSESEQTWNHFHSWERERQIWGWAGWNVCLPTLSLPMLQAWHLNQSVGSFILFIYFLVMGTYEGLGIPFWNLSISSSDPFVGEPWDQAIKTWMAGISQKQRNLYWITSKGGNKASALD